MKKIIYSFLFLGTIIALGGCKEDSYEDLIPEQYDKILYLKTSGQQTLELFDDGSQVDYSLTVVKTGSNPAATAQAQVKIMSQAEVDNDPRYQGNNYKVLSSDCYTFKSELFDLTSAETYKMINMKLSPAKILEEITENTDENSNDIYIIPFRLSSPNDPVNQEMKDLILKLNVTKLGISFKKGSQTIDLNTTTGDEWVFEARVAMVSGVQNTWDFTAQVTVDYRNEVLEAYNTLNNTSYLMVPQAAVVYVNDAVFEADNNESAGTIRIRRDGLNKGYTYLIPLKLEPIEDIETISVSDKLHYIILEYPLDPEDDKIELRLDMLSDPLNCSGGDGTTLIDLIDGEISTYYHTTYSAYTGNPTYGQPVDIAFDSPIRSLQLEYVTRSDNNNGVPTLIKLFISNDGAEWTELTTLSNGLPSGTSEAFKSKVLTASEGFSHLRFSVMSSPLGSCTGVANDDGRAPCWSLAELRIWGSN